MWNSLGGGLNETNRESSKAINSNNNVHSKIDQLILNPAKTEYSQIKVPSFTKNSGFIINPVDKSILPIIKTDHVKAANETKRNRYIDNSLYHV